MPPVLCGQRPVQRGIKKLRGVTLKPHCFLYTKQDPEEAICTSLGSYVFVSYIISAQKSSNFAVNLWQNAIYLVSPYTFWWIRVVPWQTNSIFFICTPPFRSAPDRPSRCHHQTTPIPQGQKQLRVRAKTYGLCSPQ